MLRLDMMVLALALGVGGAQSQGWSEQLSRVVEMPAHQWLADQRAVTDGPDAFTTDGCSGGMSSLWVFVAERYPAFAEAHGGVPPWEACCRTHDRAYHSAGSNPAPEASYAARLDADRALQLCVQATASDRDQVLIDTYGLTAAQVRTAYEAIAASMFQAVRLGGGPCTGLPWRWGYGYPQCWGREAD